MPATCPATTPTGCGACSRSPAELLRTAGLLREGFRLGEQLVDRVEALGPESRVGEVEPHDLGQHLRRIGTSGPQQVEVGPDDPGSLPLVAAEDGEGEQIAERVGVDVAGRPDEMGDVAPPDLVAVG